MLRRIGTTLIVVPLAAIIIAFAVANRQPVMVSFDPFSSTFPAYVVTLPLFAVILAVLILGVLIGGVAAWLRQGKWRRSARRLDGEVRALHNEIAAARARYSSAPQPTAPKSIPLAVLPRPGS